MRTIIELPGEQVDALDALCRRDGISRAEAIRRAVAMLVRAEGSEVSGDELIAFAKQNLASYKAPKRVVVIDYAEMPINYSGKLIKRDLRAMIASRLAQS